MEAESDFLSIGQELVGGPITIDLSDFAKRDNLSKVDFVQAFNFAVKALDERELDVLELLSLNEGTVNDWKSGVHCPSPRMRRKYLLYLGKVLGGDVKVGPPIPHVS